MLIFILFLFSVAFSFHTEKQKQTKSNNNKSKKQTKMIIIPPLYKKRQNISFYSKNYPKNYHLIALLTIKNFTLLAFISVFPY